MHLGPAQCRDVTHPILPTEVRPKGEALQARFLPGFAQHSILRRFSGQERARWDLNAGAGTRLREEEEPLPMRHIGEYLMRSFHAPCSHTRRHDRILVNLRCPTLSCPLEGRRYSSPLPDLSHLVTIRDR
ncbi:MAG: hypothetical protein NVS4B2_28020 [Chloroflexota bacterium]